MLIKLEVQINAYDEREGTGVDVTVNAIEHFGVDAVVLGNGEHV